MVGDGVVQSRHFGWQPVLELTCDQVYCSGSKWLLFFPKMKEFMKGHKSFWWREPYRHGKWLAGRPITTVLLQRNENFGETLDQVHFSCRRICRKVTKYDVRISLLTVSVYELFERPSYVGSEFQVDGAETEKAREVKLLVIPEGLARRFLLCLPSSKAWNCAVNSVSQTIILCVCKVDIVGYSVK